MGVFQRINHIRLQLMKDPQVNIAAMPLKRLQPLDDIGADAVIPALGISILIAPAIGQAGPWLPDTLRRWFPGPDYIRGI